MGDRARSVGLDGETLARRMGRALGEAVAGKNPQPPLARAEALDELAALLTRSGLGAMTVVSLLPLVLRVEPFSAAARGPRGCAHVAGFLEGALGHLVGKPAGIREIDCVGAGSDDCTFACEL